MTMLSLRAKRLIAAVPQHEALQASPRSFTALEMIRRRHAVACVRAGIEPIPGDRS
jgi:hypothetical protein